MVPYLLAQGTGAVAAAFSLHTIFGSAAKYGATLPAVSTASAFTLEWLLSFALMLVIMAVATDQRAADGFAAMAVGLTVGFCALMGGPITGASMNPARSFGPAVAEGLWRSHWIYWLAPVTAMMAAARTYEFLRAATPPPLPGDTVLGIQGPVSSPADAAPEKP